MKKIFLLSVFSLSLLLAFNNINAQYYYDRAFSFSGVEGDYIATDPGSALSITGDFTIDECWVKPSDVTGTPILIQKRLGHSVTGTCVSIPNSTLLNPATTINYSIAKKRCLSK